MKFVVILFTLFAISAADVSELSDNKYLPPGGDQQASSVSTRQDVSSGSGAGDDSVVVTAEETVNADDSGSQPGPGPQAPDTRIGDAPGQGPSEPEPAHQLNDDGYQYKTVRRVRYRYRT